MIQVITANEKKWQVDISKNGILVDGQPFEWDLQELQPGHFHLLHQHQSYRVEVIEADYQQKTFLLQLNGQQHRLHLQDRFDLLLEQMGISAANPHQVNEVKAPMPGLIVAIQVAAGQEVKKGDPLLILEAMKMENILKSPGDGRVKAIKVNLRDKVEKNQVLIQFS
ncbi:MAG: biotin/lipoyl-containing protein [Adhaeribacter sp.]